MSNTVGEIVNLLEKRRQRLRSWVAPDSHPLVISQVRDAYAALGAMTGVLDEMAPALSRLLVDAIGLEQQARSMREEQKVRDKEKARQLRHQAQAEDEPEHAAFLETLARSYENSIDIPDMSDVRVAGVLLTASKLYRAADQVSRSRDAEAIKTLGLKALSTAGKWALKLTPIRQEDLQDLKDAWETLKTITEPLDDATAILEAGKMRVAQAKAASSLFERLQVVRELAQAWCRAALKEPFLAEAINVDDAEAALTDRLHRSRQEWT
jgi:soluble cytochrome b562